MKQIQKSTATNGRLISRDEKGRRFTFVVSTENPDRDSDTVDQASINWKEFDHGGAPATLSHDTEKIPVGKWLPETRRLAKVKDPNTGQEVLGTLMDFVPNPHTAEGIAVGRSIADDFLGGASISFLPDEEKTQKNEHGGSYYEGARISEVAICSVPANSSATRRAAMLCKSLKRKPTHKGKSMSIKLWRNKSDATRIRIMRKDLITFSQIDEAKRRATKDAPSAESQVDDEAAAEPNYDNEGVGTTGNVPPEVNLELMDDTSKVDGDEDWVEESMDAPEQEGKGLDYPNDPDGGGRRVAAIQMLERKLGMAERDGDTARADKYRQQLEDAKDANKPLKSKTEDYADSTANRAQEMDLDSADEMMALDAAMEEEQVPQAMRGAVKALALKKLKVLKTTNKSGKYTAWVSGSQGSQGASTASGDDLSSVKRQAEEVINSGRWRTRNPNGGYVTITEGSSQRKLENYEVKSKSTPKAKADDATDDKDCGDMPGYKYLKAAIDHLQSNMKSIEHKDVLAAAQKALAALTGGMSKAYGKDAYPGDQQEVIEGEGDEAEDTLMSKEQTPVEVEGVWTIYDPTTDEYVGEFASEEEASRGITDMAKPPESEPAVSAKCKSWKRTKANRHLIVKGLNKAQKSTIGDAVEFMEGCSESKDMPKHLKSGHKHHALSLKSMLESKQEDMEPQMSKEAEEEMTLALQKVLQKQEEFDKGMKRKFGQQWEKVGQENGNRLQWDN